MDVQAESLNPSSGSIPRAETYILRVLMAVQFVNVLDFMMVMPLGPDFARALNIPLSQLGMIGGIYTGAASLAGVAGAFFLDRFDRKKALLVAMLGLSIATLLGGLAWNFHSLLVARIIAGLFGGPAVSLILSIISDQVPTFRRGRAMGAVMGVFSIASVLGVPAGLELARIGGWRFPFFAVGLLALLVCAAAFKLLPTMRDHLANPQAATLAQTKPVQGRGHAFGEMGALAILSLGLSMISGFLLIPNVSSFVQFNLHYPREHLGFLYFVGGMATFFSMRIVGKWVDRYGATRISFYFTLVLSGAMWMGFAREAPWMSAPLIFIFFMVCMSSRNIAINAMSSRVPEPWERARYMSFQSAVQHLMAAAGSIFSTRILLEGPGGRLEGMPRLVGLSIGSMVLIPPIVARVERLLRERAARSSNIK